MDIVRKMAHMILEDPFLTAGDLAKKLGYAEEKTIYYWLSKENYPGLQAFKRAVIAGRYIMPPLKARESHSAYGRIPLLEGFDENGAAILTTDSLSDDMSANVLGRFAWHYHGPQQGPIQNGDMLLLIKLEPSDRAKWVLAGAPRTPTVLMKIMDGDTVVYVHPETYEPATVPAQLHGIVQIIRAMV